MSDKQLSVLGLFRDMGAANVGATTLEALRERGHRIRILAENGGLARERLQVPFMVVHNIQELRGQMADFRPDVVISGLSAPRHLEAELDAASVIFGAKLVHIEDYWGAHTRASCHPDLYVTVDEMAQRLVKKKSPNVPTAITGFAGIAPVTPPSQLLEQYEKKRQETGAIFIIVPDDEPELEESLPMLVESIRMTKQRIMFIPRIRGKFKDELRGNGKTWGEWITEQFVYLREAGLVWDPDLPKLTTDQIAELPDIAIASGFSSVLFRAAKKGNLPLTLWNETIRRGLKEATGLDEAPLMLDGRYPVLTEPRSLDEFFRVSHPKYDLKPFDASAAADAIESLVR